MDAIYDMDDYKKMIDMYIQGYINSGSILGISQQRPGYADISFRVSLVHELKK